MVCIYCSYKTSIINSRHWQRNNATWRRRQCCKCKAIFTTNELAQYDSLWTVFRVDIRILSPFMRDKLYLSIYDSCKHRKSAIADASGLTDTVINKLRASVKDGSLSISDIRNITLNTVNKLDETSGVYYRAYHGPI
jgi:transcriptional regulator NrdR family protein